MTQQQQQQYGGFHGGAEDFPSLNTPLGTVADWKNKVKQQGVDLAENNFPSLPQAPAQPPRQSLVKNKKKQQHVQQTISTPWGDKTVTTTAQPQKKEEPFRGNGPRRRW
jgi:hypothetical protein